MAEGTGSCAVGQTSVLGGEVLPLFPPIVDGIETVAANGTRFRSSVEVVYNYPSVFKPERGTRGSALERFSPYLPPFESSLCMGEGDTPLLREDRLASWAGIEGKVYLKMESLNPTLSHKDRATVFALSSAIQSGAEAVSLASSGNQAISAAAYCARAGMPCFVLLAKGVGTPILQRIQALGAVPVEVDRSNRWPILCALREKFGVFPITNVTREHTGNPFGPEGYKTVAYELFEQLEGKVPDAVIIPTGYGELLFGIYKGFRELHQFGLLKRLPKMIACQNELLSPLGCSLEKAVPQTIPYITGAVSSGISVNTTSTRAIVGVLGSQGEVVNVSNEDILDAQHALRLRGIQVEPASAASVAALKKIPHRGLHSVACVLTASEGKILPSSVLPGTDLQKSNVREILDFVQAYDGG